jgi:hypothetical protein
VEELARFLMERLHAKRLKGVEESNGRYSPTSAYEVGDKLLFPSVEDEVGEVVGVRAGENQRYGEFRVIQVRFPEQGETREFASELSPDFAHLLAVVENPPLNVKELFSQFGSYATAEVEAALEASDNFVQVGTNWLPKLMLVNFHEGHLNIAEAMIDITGEPLPTSELLKEISIEEEATDAVSRFSLDYLLSHDARFTNAGTATEPLWHLARLR